MKKKLYIVLTLVCCFVLATSFIGCNKKFDDDSKITPPINNEAPIVGMYQYKPFEDIKIIDRVLRRGIINIYFDKSNIYLDDKLYSDVTYKTRTVDAEQYTVYYLKCSKDDVGLKSDKINVISIYENSNLVLDVIDLGANKILAIIDEKVTPMEKSKNDLNSPGISKTNMSEDKSQGLIKLDKKSSSTLLVGIRNMKEDKNIDKLLEVGDIYSTIGLNISNKKVEKVHRAPLLIIPRKTGFWSVDNYRLETPYGIDNAYESKILSKSDKNGNSLDKNINKLSNGQYKYLSLEELKMRNIRCFPLDSFFSTNRINFVCDNYIGFESVYNANNTSTLTDKERIEYSQMYTLDGINRSPINLKSMLSVDNYNNYKNIEKSLNIKNQTLSSENFALRRKNGYWSVVNKVLDYDNKRVVNEIVLNIDPRKDIVKYDELHVSWSSVKDKIPFAIDAFCSPNKEAVVIITERKMYVFNVENNDIRDKIYEMELKDGDNVIMAEWATGEYADKWIDFCAKY